MLFHSSPPEIDFKPQNSGTIRLLVCCLLLEGLWGCGADVRDEHVILRLGTTTTIRDSGLLDQLVPTFERQHAARVDVIASGTGKTLALGRAGEVDLIWVHEPRAEATFMDQGHGTRHETIMWNSFVLLGPRDDPARIASLDVSSALQKVAASDVVFCSRGDKSGTHERELTLWESGGGRPEWNKYYESGQGAGPTLWMADELQGYTLSDYGTYLKFRPRISLVAYSDQAPQLINRYSAVLIAPAKHPAIRAGLAREFMEFLIAPATQATIEAFTIDAQPLFHPAATLPVGLPLP